MTKNRYLVIAVIFTAIAIYGVLSFFSGRIRQVNVGIFVVPCAIAIFFYNLHRKNNQKNEGEKNERS